MAEATSTCAPAAAPQFPTTEERRHHFNGATELDLSPRDAAGLYLHYAHALTSLMSSTADEAGDRDPAFSVNNTIVGVSLDAISHLIVLAHFHLERMDAERQAIHA